MGLGWAWGELGLHGLVFIRLVCADLVDERSKPTYALGRLNELRVGSEGVVDQFVIGHHSDPIRPQPLFVAPSGLRVVPSSRQPADKADGLNGIMGLLLVLRDLLAESVDVLPELRLDLGFVQLSRRSLEFDDHMRTGYAPVADVHSNGTIGRNAADHGLQPLFHMLVACRAFPRRVEQPEMVEDVLLQDALKDILFHLAVELPDYVQPLLDDLEIPSVVSLAYS